MSDTCESCKFWVNESYKLGVCRRHSPTGLIETSDCSGSNRRAHIWTHEARWPQTDANDFCGDWEAAEETPA